MKPSERRALEAQKRAQKEADELERKAADVSGDISEEPQASPCDIADDMSRPERKKSKKPKEKFFKRYPRLIAFLATSFVILTLLSPFAVDGFLSARDNWGVVTDKQDITLEQVYYVADNYGNIGWRSFDGFNYTARRRGWRGYRNEYPIKDTSFSLVVGGASKTGTPEYIYIQSYIDGEVRDLAEDDIRKFVDKYNKEEQ